MGIGKPHIVKKGDAVTTEMEADLLTYLQTSYKLHKSSYYLYVVDYMRKKYGGVWKCHLAHKMESPLEFASVIAVSNDYSICVDQRDRRLFLWRSKEEPKVPPPPPPPEDDLNS